MQIKKLRLENIRSYKSQEIAFPKGALLLSGDIGSGKSTVLLALEFGLFGLLRGSTSGSDLLRNGCKEGSVDLHFSIAGKEVVVKRTLKRSKDTIQQSTGYIIIDGRKSEGTPVELKSRVLELMGYPRELLSKSKSLIFRYTIYTPQEEMKSIIFEDKEARLDTLRKVFGIEKYKRMRENAAIYARRLKERSKELEGYLSDLDDKKKQDKEYDKRLDEINKDYNELKGKFSAAEEKHKAADEKLNKINEDKKKAEEIKVELRLRDTRLKSVIERQSELKKELDKLEPELEQDSKEINKSEPEPTAVKAELDKTEKNLSKIEKDINSNNEKLSGKEQELKLYDSRLASGKERLKEISEEIKSIKDEIDKAQKELDSLDISESWLKEELVKTEKSLQSARDSLLEEREKIGGINISIKSSDELINKISRLDTCPTCEQEVKESHKSMITRREKENIERLKKNIGEISSKLKKSKQDSERLEAYKKELEQKSHKLSIAKLRRKAVAEKESRIKKLKEMQGKIEAENSKIEQVKKRKAASEIKAIKAEKERLLDMHEKAKVALKNLREQFQRSETLLIKSKAFKQKSDRVISLKKEILNLKHNIGSINSEKLRLNSQLERYKSIEGEHERYSGIVKETDKEKKALEIRLERLNQEKETIGKISKSLKSEIEKKLKAYDEHKRLGSWINWMEENFMSLAIQIEKHVMMTVYREFNELFRKWFNILIEDELISVRLDYEFTPIVEQNGYETDVGSLSGGEKTSCALAYRLALNKVINDLISTINTKDIIILDEPTDGFSNEQLDRVRDVIDRLNIPQTIIVSHEQKIEGFVDNVIRIKKTDHASEACVLGGYKIG